MKKIIITEKKEIKIVGLTLRSSFENGKSQRDIPEFFHRNIEEKSFENISNRINNNQLCIFRFRNNSPVFDYTMGVEVGEFDLIPENMERIILPPLKYASLSIIKKGHEDVGAAFRYLMEEWLVDSGYKLSPSPGFIYYDESFFSVFNKYGYEGNPPATVYLPVEQDIKKIMTVSV